MVGWSCLIAGRLGGIVESTNGRKQDSVGDLFVVITAGIGLLLSTLDTGIINVAMPTLVLVFHSTISGVAWTVTLYTLALTGTIIIFGRLSDRFGHLRVYAWGLSLFGVSSVLSLKPPNEVGQTPC